MSVITFTYHFSLPVAGDPSGLSPDFTHWPIFLSEEERGERGVKVEGKEGRGEERFHKLLTVRSVALPSLEFLALPTEIRSLLRGEMKGYGERGRRGEKGEMKGASDVSTHPLHLLDLSVEFALLQASQQTADSRQHPTSSPLLTGKDSIALSP